MFQGARLKLTAWYLLIIMLISITFSAVIYRVLLSEFTRFEQNQRFRIERRIQEGYFPRTDIRIRPIPVVIASPELIEETRQRVLLMLAIINAGILVVSGGLGYMLAGRTLQPIKEMVDEQNRFISDASHELKTPLTSLKSAFEVFLRDKNKTLPEATTIIRDSIGDVNKLQVLSESMLQLAQYQLPNGHTRFEKLSISPIIDEAVHKLEPVAKQKEIKIIQKVKDNKIIGNKYSLTDLFVIFLDNAVKYSSPKSKVEISTQEISSSVYIHIKDWGIGISEKDIPHIFDRFYRADSARQKADTGGYGLGLSIAKKIIEIHKGSVRVESKLKRGSKFTIILPVLQSARLNYSK